MYPLLPAGQAQAPSKCRLDGRACRFVLGHIWPRPRRALSPLCVSPCPGAVSQTTRRSSDGFRSWWPQVATPGSSLRHTVGRWGRLTTRCAAGECLKPRTRPTAWFFSGPRARRTSAPPHSFPCPWAAPQLFLSLGCCCCICCCICCCRRLCCICRMGRTCHTRRICCASVSQARRISAPPHSFPCPSSR